MMLIKRIGLDYYLVNLRSNFKNKNIFFCKFNNRFMYPPELETKKVYFKIEVLSEENIEKEDTIFTYKNFKIKRLYIIKKDLDYYLIDKKNITNIYKDKTIFLIKENPYFYFPAELENKYIRIKVYIKEEYILEENEKKDVDILYNKYTGLLKNIIKEENDDINGN